MPKMKEMVINIYSNTCIGIILSTDGTAPLSHTVAFSAPLPIKSKQLGKQIICVF